MAIDDLREESIGPIGVHPFTRRVELLHLAPHSLAVLEDWHPEACDTFVRDVDDVLRVVQEGHGVVIAPEQENPSVAFDESFEGRLATECIVPRLAREQKVDLFAP